jgi:hypothetical protein
MSQEINWYNLTNIDAITLKKTNVEETGQEEYELGTKIFELPKIKYYDEFDNAAPNSAGEFEKSWKSSPSHLSKATVNDIVNGKLKDFSFYNPGKIIEPTRYARGPFGLLSSRPLEGWLLNSTPNLINRLFGATYGMIDKNWIKKGAMTVRKGGSRQKSMKNNKTKKLLAVANRQLR